MATSSAAPAVSPDTPVARLLDEGVRKANSGDMEGALAAFNAILRIDPDNFDAVNNIGIAYCTAGSLEQGRPYLEKAFALSPGDTDVRNNLLLLYGRLFAAFTDGNDFTAAMYVAERQIEIIPADRNVRNNLILLYKKVAADHYFNEDFAAAADTVRKWMALDPTGRSRLEVDLIDALHRAGGRAQLSDFAPGLRPEDLGRHLLIACMPKSGSSFLKQSLRSLTGWQERFFTFAFMRNEQELHLPAMVDAARTNSVTQQHCRATQANVLLLQAFDIRPIVLVRNLHDIVVSLTDFYDGGAAYDSFLSRSWYTLSETQRLDAIIDHIVPWYLSFYASWVEALESGRLDGMMVSYEDMITDKPGTLASIAEFVGLDKSVEECAAAVSDAEGNKAATRMNKGVTGRGAEKLSDAQKARIAQLTKAYATTDFSRIGL